MVCYVDGRNRNATRSMRISGGLNSKDGLCMPELVRNDTSSDLDTDETIGNVNAS